MQGVSTPLDWKCLMRYSSSLIIKITIWSAFNKKTSTEIIAAKYMSYFDKKNHMSLSKSNWYFIKPISILQWTDKFN